MGKCAVQWYSYRRPVVPPHLHLVPEHFHDPSSEGVDFFSASVSGNVSGSRIRLPLILPPAQEPSHPQRVAPRVCGQWSAVQAVRIPDKAAGHGGMPPCRSVAVSGPEKGSLSGWSRCLCHMGSSLGCPEHSKDVWARAWHPELSLCGACVEKPQKAARGGGGGQAWNPRPLSCLGVPRDQALTQVEKGCGLYELQNRGL